MTIKASRCRFVYFVIKVTKTIRKMVLIERAEQIPCNNWQDFILSELAYRSYQRTINLNKSFIVVGDFLLDLIWISPNKRGSLLHRHFPSNGVSWNMAMQFKTILVYILGCHSFWGKMKKIKIRIQYITKLMVRELDSHLTKLIKLSHLTLYLWQENIK